MPLPAPSGPRRRLLFALVAGVLGLQPAAMNAGESRGHSGLPPIPISSEAGDPALQVALGRRLFMDPQISEDGTMACATCHIPEHGFALNGAPTAFGRGGRVLRRNSPTVLNAALATSQFLDGRMATLEDQIWGPLLSIEEAWNPTVQDVVGRLEGRADYRREFRAAFAGRKVSARLVGAAIAAYERSLASGLSRFDRWRYGGDAAALTPTERAGFDVFQRSGCPACHTVGADFAPFTDNSFRNTGIEWARIRGALGTPKSVPDAGRFEVTGREGDRHAFRVPSLRNVGLTAPYMHDGSLATLAQVVDWYDAGGGADPGRDPALRPLGLDATDKASLVAFLEALTSQDVERLIAEARGTPGAGTLRPRKL
jgi:cytochrome c peroxidase